MSEFNVEKLREKLGKLKDKEARLEADLAIKEHPELEEPIISIMLALIEVRKAEANARMIAKPVGTVSKEVTSILAQIKYHESKLVALNAQLVTLTGADGKVMSKSETGKVKAITELQKTFGLWNDILSEAGVEVLELIPSLGDYVRVAVSEPEKTT